MLAVWSRQDRTRTPPGDRGIGPDSSRGSRVIVLAFNWARAGVGRAPRLQLAAEGNNGRRLTAQTPGNKGLVWDSFPGNKEPGRTTGDDATRAGESP